MALNAARPYRVELGHTKFRACLAMGALRALADLLLYSFRPSNGGSTSTFTLQQYRIAIEAINTHLSYLKQHIDIAEDMFQEEDDGGV